MIQLDLGISSSSLSSLQVNYKILFKYITGFATETCIQNLNWLFSYIHDVTKLNIFLFSYH